MEQKRIKILYLITQSIIGGAQKYVFDLATNLDKEKYEVAVAAGGDGELFKKLESAGVKIFRLKWLRRPIRTIRDTFAYFEIKKLLKGWQPDVLHLNSSKAAVLGSLAARNLPIKVIYTVHGAVFEAPFSRLARKLFLWLEKWTAKYKHKIICVSEHDRQLWLKYNVAPPEKLVTIHNGINFDSLQFLEKKEVCRERFSAICRETFSAGPAIIGTIANLYPEKGLKHLIEAADIIRTSHVRKNSSVPLFLVIGEGPERNKLENLIKKYNLQNTFYLLGYLPNASQYLKAFDIFVSPSVKEGLPYTILQAMAAGLPIVATWVGGIPEMIIAQKTGLLIEPKNSQDLAEKIIYLLNNPEIAKNLGQQAQDKVREEFFLEKMVKETENLYFISSPLP